MYSALRKAPQMISDMDHSFANYTTPAFTPQPQSINALWLVLILPSVKGSVDLDGWLHTEIVPPPGVEPEHGHPSQY